MHHFLSAVVPYTDLKKFLTWYIEKNEKSKDPADEPDDLADEFLEFVKKRAGLFIEIGDKQYSFVHLTFQEYLTASHIITSNEHLSVEDGIWNVVKDFFLLLNIYFKFLNSLLNNFFRNIPRVIYIA